MTVYLLGVLTGLLVSTLVLTLAHALAVVGQAGADTVNSSHDGGGR